MKKLFSTLAILVSGMGVALAQAQTPSVLIDTQFDQLNPSGGLQVLSVKEVAESALPLKMPTTVRITPPSAAMKAESAIENLRPPWYVNFVTDHLPLLREAAKEICPSPPMKITPFRV